MGSDPGNEQQSRYRAVYLTDDHVRRAGKGSAARWGNRSAARFLNTSGTSVMFQSPSVSRIPNWESFESIGWAPRTDSGGLWRDAAKRAMNRRLSSFNARSGPMAGSAGRQIGHGRLRN